MDGADVSVGFVAATKRTIATVSRYLPKFNSDTFTRQ